MAVSNDTLSSEASTTKPSGLRPTLFLAITVPLQLCVPSRGIEQSSGLESDDEKELRFLRRCFVPIMSPREHVVPGGDIRQPSKYKLR